MFTKTIPTSSPRLGLPIFLVTLVAAAALVPGTALARTSRLHQSSFGSFSERTPGTVAVDQSTGDVYVAATAFSTGTVSRFTSTGAADNFTAGPDAGTNTLTSSPHLTDVAVDNSAGPLHGDIYLVESETVKVFAEDGSPLGVIDGSGTPEVNFEGNYFGQACGVAVDAASGDLYIAAENLSGEARIWRYAPNSPAGTIDDSDFAITGIIPDHQICRIAVDESNGRVYGAEKNSAGVKSLFAYPTAPFATHPLQVGAIARLTQSVSAVAVDPADGQVYANEGDRISVFDTSGEPLYHFGSGADFGGISSGVAVRSNPPGSAAVAYVTDPVDDQVDAFGATTQVTALTHPAIATFGSDGTLGSVFPGAGSNLVDGFAFDQAARRLYVASGSEVFGFDASMPPSFPRVPVFAPPNPGLFPGFAVDNTALSSAGNTYLATGHEADGLIYGFNSVGNPLGGSFPIDPATTPGSPAGSPKELCGSAVDSAGDLFVANLATKHVLEYSSAGAFLKSIDTSAQGGGACALAFASNDDLYMAITGKGVWRYTAASAYSSATRIAKSAGQPGIAVDPSTGDLFVTGGDVGSDDLPARSWIDQYDSAGNFVDEFDPGIESSDAPTLTVDPADHDLYAADPHDGVIRVFGPGVIFPEVSPGAPSAISNTQATLTGSVNDQADVLTDCHFEYVSEAAFRLSGFSDLSSGGSVPCAPSAGSIPHDLNDHAVTGTAAGLTANTDYRYRLSAANANGTTTTADLGFTAAGPPIVETVGSPIRTATTVRFDSRVDPRAAATTVHFEYGTAGPCSTSSCTATTPVSAGSADLTRLVSQQVTGLEPGTTYHYRIAADNGNPDGPAFGEDMTVTTRASDAPLEHGSFPGPPGSDRAWEQVNAPDTGGNPVSEAEGISDSGERAVYRVLGGTPTSDTGGLFTQAFAERAETAPHRGSWRPSPIHPPRAQTLGANWNPPAADGELSTLFDENPIDSGIDLWQLTPGGSPAKLVADENIGDLYVPENGSRVVVSLPGSLDPVHPFVAPAGARYLYDVTSGTPKLVSFLPDQSVPTCGAHPNNANEFVYDDGGFQHRGDHWISPDGNLVYFPSQGSGSCAADQPSQLYVRDLVAGTTRMVSPPPLSGAACSAAFIKSTPGAVFFWSQSRLASEDVAPPSGCAGQAGGDIYRYVLATGAVDCVTCVVPGLDAEVGVNLTQRAGYSIAVAGDGSRVYFMTTRHLLAGAPPEGQSAIYRVAVTTGSLAFVAPGAGAAVGDAWHEQQTTLTPDGSVFVFRSADADLDALTDSENGGTAQYYRYDDRERSLICVSCPQDGSAPRASVDNAPTDGVSPNMTPLDAGGDFFFPSVTALVPADKNTAAPGTDPASGTDVYEWRDGRLSLVSDGVTVWPTGSNGDPGSTPRFDGVSPSGRDAFFTEAAELTPDATDAFARLYDARVGGGFEFPAAKAPCPLEECQGVPAPTPEDPFAATLSFQGPGNQTPPPPPTVKCRKGDVLRSGKCVPALCPKKEVRRKGKCVPAPCPKKQVLRKGKCVRTHANNDRRRHTTARPGSSHR